MWPEQPSWPQVQTISVLSAIPSQWALQYLDLSAAMQLQAAFAHFLALAMVLLNRPTREIQAASAVDPWDAKWGGKVVRATNRLPGTAPGWSDKLFVDPERAYFAIGFRAKW
jgi:hypothetical protein